MSYEKYECFSSAAVPVFNVGFVSCRLPVTHFSYARYSPRPLTLSVFLVIDILVRGCSFSSAKNAPSNGERGHSGARTLMSLAMPYKYALNERRVRRYKAARYANFNILSEAARNFLPPPVARNFP